jgi:hypothetical protein
MRGYLRALLLALAIGPLTPEMATCQEDFDDEEFDDAPPPRRVFDRPRSSWRSSPVVWMTVGVVMCVAIPFSLYKLIRGMQQCQVDQSRPKQPWEIAMEQAERDRLKH